MVGIRIAVQTKCLRQPLKKALHTAGQLACDGVQIDARTELRPSELSDTGVRQMKKMLDDLNLRVGTVAMPTRRGLTSPDQLEKRFDAIHAAMQMTSRLGARTLITNLGEVPGDDASVQEQFADVVAQLSIVGQRLGVRIALQAYAPADELADLLNGLPEAALGVDLHPAELLLHSQDPQEYVTAVGKHVLHVHAVDAVRGIGAAGAVEVELGRGSAELPELLGMLEEYDYQGWATISRNNSPHPLQDVADAVQFLRSL